MNTRPRAPAAATPHGPGDAPVSHAYLVALFGTLLGAFALFYAGLLGLSFAGRLPPPAFSNSICVDEKIEFLREHRPEQPNFLVIGSSVAWRHFDGETFRREVVGAVPFNGGFCGMRAGQTELAAAWLVDRLPSVRQVLFVAAPQDFEDCTTKPPLFDRDDVDAYVFGGAMKWPYYTRYFSPMALVRNAVELADKRSGRNTLDPLVFDRYGAGPLRDSPGRGSLHYGDVARLDPACFQAVLRLGLKLKQEGRELLVATTPLHAQWRLQYRATEDSFHRQLEAATVAGGGRFWDVNAERATDAPLFFDAIHLHWAGVPPFTGALVQAFGLARPQALHARGS